MPSLKSKTLFVTGASRGIGKAIALAAARDGANVAVAAKTDTADPHLPGTIHSAAEEIVAAGGQALAVVVDVRDEAQVRAAVDAAVARFGGIDILVNNASAIHLETVERTPMKRYDLMFEINARGSYLCAQACLPHLEKAANPHILTLSPPLDLNPKWFARHAAYTTSKYAMSMLSRGLAEELRERGIASNSLWPRTVIATSALRIAAPEVAHQLNLRADMADAAWQAAQQTLMLRTAERYLELALAQEALHLLDRQLAAVQQAAAEADDRFALGDAPITDTHEARARLAGLQAQRVAAQTALEVKRRALADSTGLPAVTAHLPASVPTSVEVAQRPLPDWQSEAEAASPAIRQQALALELARADAERHSRSASATVDLIAQAGQERLHGNGDYGSARSKGTQALVGVQLTVPLSTGGLRAAQEEEALRLAEQAEAQATREDVARRVHAAWLGLSVGAQRVQALADALHASEARQGATRLGHAVGDRTLLDRLNAENDAGAARLALAQARAGLLLDHRRLAALAGRLDKTAQPHSTP